MALLICMCGSSECITLSITFLEERSGLSRATVYRYLTKLENHGLLLRSTDPVSGKLVLRIKTT
jgi:DNA-binding IclR family transcriptional regulator